jgi:hypothetical protein
VANIELIQNPIFEIGTVQTNNDDSSVTLTQVGNVITLNFGLERGDRGSKGDDGKDSPDYITYVALIAAVATIEGQIAGIYGSLGALSVSITALQSELTTIQSQITTMETEITTLNTDVDLLQSKTTGISYLTGTTYIDNNVRINTVNNLDTSYVKTTYINPNNIEKQIVIGDADQSNYIYLNGTIIMPLNNLFNNFSGFVSQL